MPFAYQYITTADARDRAISALAREPVIGVDIEGASLHRYRDRVSLIQISGAEDHYVFDPLRLDTVLPLGALLENRSILKVFHGADYDLASLKRDFGFRVAPIFDTALAARAAGIAPFSLQSLIERFFQVRVSKAHQKSDWSCRPLSTSQLDYAVADTAYLIRLYECLQTAVAERGRTDQIEEECRLLSEIEWSDPDEADPMQIRGASKLPTEAKRIFPSLVALRNRLAEARDVPRFKVMSNDDLFRLAKAAPTDYDGLVKCFDRPRSTLLRHAEEWLAAVAAGQSAPVPQTDRVRTPRRPPPTPAQEQTISKLIQWRNAQAMAEGVEPAMVLTHGVIRRLVMEGVCTSDALAPFLRQWQIRRYADALMTHLAPAASSSAPTPSMAFSAPADSGPREGDP